jgi:choline dehydrogenase
MRTFRLIRAQLHPARYRRNLTIRRRALVTRLLIEGEAATGVDYTLALGRERNARASEAILCGGAFNSPQLLRVPERRSRAPAGRGSDTRD